MFGRLVKLVALAAVAALIAGVWLGGRFPYGDKQLRTVDAVAVRHAAGLVLADEKDGDRQFGFLVRDILWTSASAHGEGDPPCLKERGRKVDVEIGFLSIRVPDGTTYHDQALWVRCP